MMDIEEGELVAPDVGLPEGLGVFETVRVETDALPPLIELGRRLLVKAQEGDAAAVKELMGQGAPFTTDWLGTSPLHWACQLNHIEVVDTLLKAGISRDAKNKVDRTPLHAASQEGHVEVVKLLLKYGVDVDAVDMLQMTALHWAAEFGHEEVVRLLLEHGIDPCAINKFDKTADQIAYDNSRFDITHVIQEYADSPLKHARRKEAKERQKMAAAAMKATMELEKMYGRPNVPFKTVVNGDRTSRATNDGVRVIKVSPNSHLPVSSQNMSSKVVFENNLKYTNTSTTSQTHAQIPQQEDNTEKTLAMLQAHGITMLPTDESTIVQSAVQSGQKVVLTEAGKMALNQTEGTVTSPPGVKKIIKLPELLKGKKLIKINPDQLLKMKNENRVVIQTDKKFKPSIFTQQNGQPAVQADKGKPAKEVVVKKILFNNRRLLTSTIVEKPVETFSIPSEVEEEMMIRVDEEREETELEKIRRELEETKQQVRLLREQYLKKDKEAEEYKKLINLLRGEK